MLEELRQTNFRISQSLIDKLLAVAARSDTSEKSARKNYSPEEPRLPLRRASLNAYSNGLFFSSQENPESWHPTRF